MVHHQRGVRGWLLVAAGAAAALGVSSFFFQPAEGAVRECRLPVPTPDAVVEAVSAPMFIPDDPTPAPKLRRPRPVAEAAVQKLLDAGTALAAQGKHKAAVKQFETARALAPKNADVFYGIALSRYELGQSKLAAIAAARAITFDADHPGTTLLLGFISQESGAFQSSRKLYEEYLSYAPESESATELKSVLAQLPKR